MKLLRTIRLDPSDTFVFERAAEPGEWAISGTFVFSDIDPDALRGKARTSFRAGFLGIDTLGWSTLVQIVEATADDRAAIVDTLADRLVQHFGAPDRGIARAVAEDEVSFAESLCNQPANTLVAVHRTFENGELREAFRTLRPRHDERPFRAFSFLDVEDEEAPAGEAIDILNLVQGERK